MAESGLLYSMFHLGLPVVEKMVRPVIVYAALVLGLRLAGKRELAQLNPFDLVVLLLLSNTVQNAIIGEDNSVTGGLLGAATLLVANYLVVRFLIGHQRLNRIVEGGETVLIENGSIRRRALRREMISRTELEIAAHKQGFASLAEVERAILEPGGGISFISRSPSPEVRRHAEVMARLDALSAEIVSLRTVAAAAQGVRSLP